MVFYSYVPMSVVGVEVKEGKATELNLTLVAETDENPTTPSIPDSPTATSVNSASADTHSPGVDSVEKEQSSNVAIQPQDFRHHHNSDMELFLQKFSSEYSSITRLYYIGKSVQGRLLWVMEISDNPGVHELGTLPGLAWFNLEYIEKSNSLSI